MPLVFVSCSFLQCVKCRDVLKSCVVMCCGALGCATPFSYLSLCVRFLIACRVDVYHHDVSTLHMCAVKCSDYGDMRIVYRNNFDLHFESKRILLINLQNRQHIGTYFVHAQIVRTISPS